MAVSGWVTRYVLAMASVQSGDSSLLGPQGMTVLGGDQSAASSQAMWPARQARAPQRRPVRLRRSRGGACAFPQSDEVGCPVVRLPGPGTPRCIRVEGRVEEGSAHGRVPG